MPLPILSILFLGTALAAPGILRMTMNVFDDQNLTILAAVNNVVHPDGPHGKINGMMTVTNHGQTDTQLTVATATIESLDSNGNPDGRVVATITLKVPLTVKAGQTVKTPFSGPFDGNIMSLRFGDSFRVTPTITWFSVPASGPAQGPFTYNVQKTCTVRSSPLPNSAWTLSTVCS